MATKPTNMSEEQWAKHREASKAAHEARAAVEKSPTDTMLDHEARIAALESKKGATATEKKPAAKKARK